MEIGIGKGCAVGGNEQIRSLQKRSGRRHQLDLYRPMGEGRDITWVKSRLVGFFTGGEGSGKALHPGRRAAAGQSRRGFGRRRCRHFQMMLHGLFIKIFRIPFLNMESVVRTFSETGAETVAILFCRQAGLAIHNRNGAFRAGRYAQPATVTFFFIDPDNLAFDFHDTLLFVLSEFAARPSTSPASLRPSIVRKDFSIMPASRFSFTGSSFSSRFVIKSAS